MDDILKYIEKLTQVVLHKEKNGSFPFREAECSIIPQGAHVGKEIVHIGYISEHYFLIKDKSDLNHLSANDFYKPNIEEEIEEQLNTKNPVKYKWLKTGFGKEWIENPNIAIYDGVIEKRIKSYKRQDRKAKREEYELTIEDVRKILDEKKCNYCGRNIIWSNWTLDRIDNMKPHSIDNVVLACKKCNSKKKDKEQRIFIWDCEALRERLLKDKHEIYNVGVLEYSKKNIQIFNRIMEHQERIEDLMTLMDETKVYYGENSFELFENFLNDLSEEVQRKVDRKMEYWISMFDKHDQKTFEYMVKRKRTEIVNTYKCIFYAHCGANYDNQFIFKSERLQFEHIIDSFGILSISLKGGCVEFRDTAKMIGMTKLDNLCKSFKLPVMFSKTEFPHDFMSKDKINYIGKVPSSLFWPSKKIPEEHIGKTFDGKKVSIEYQKKDCISLSIVWNELSKTLYDSVSLMASDYYTAPSLAYTFLKNSLPPETISMCSDRYVDSWIREQIQGGRCFPQKIMFNSNFADDMNTIYKKEQGYLKAIEA